MQPIEFIGEVIEVKSKKTASLDVSYRITIQTDDPTVLNLGMLSGSTLIKTKIDLE